MCEFICGFCNVWVSVFVGFVIYGSFDYCLCLGNRTSCIYFVFVLFRLCIFILIC